jgi:phosphoribosyl 1,2-cyclic phosphate phosphodiesterase
MQIRFLGTSDSSGIPVHNCNCEICTFYRRLNKFENSVCAYIETENEEIILIDCGIDNISMMFDGKKIKAVFLTHFHPDHTLGLLKLRHSLDKIVCYHPHDEEGFADLYKHKKSITYIENRPFEPIEVNNIHFTPVPLVHSKNTTGYLIEFEGKKTAYLTDCARIEHKTLSFLRNSNIDICYIDACLSPEDCIGNHLNFIDASKIIDKISPKEAYLIHSNHKTLEYIKKNGIKLRYDYLTFY